MTSPRDTSYTTLINLFFVCACYPSCKINILQLQAGDLLFQCMRLEDLVARPSVYEQNIM